MVARFDPASRAASAARCSITHHFGRFERPGGGRGALELDGPLLNYSDVTRSLTTGAYVARAATLVLEGDQLLANAATIVLDGPLARFATREFSDDPLLDALGSITRNAGAGEIRLENGAAATVGGALRNAGLVTIGKNDDASDVAKNLRKRGLIRSEQVFELTVRYVDRDIKPATYTLTKGMNVSTIVDLITTEKSKAVTKVKDYKITVVEGWRTEQIADELSALRIAE